MLDWLEMWKTWRVTWLISVCHGAVLAMISTWLVGSPFLFFLFTFSLLFFLVCFKACLQIAKSAYYLRDVHLCVRVSACISLAPIGWSSMKFDIEDFYENLSRYSRYGWNLTKAMDTSRDYLSTFICCRQHYVTIRYFLQKKLYQAVMVMRYKHHMNVPQCYVIHTLLILFLFSSYFPALWYDC